MDAIIIWLGNNAVASILFSGVCTFLMLTGAIFWVIFFYERFVNVVRIKKNYFVKKEEK